MTHIRSPRRKATVAAGAAVLAATGLLGSSPAAYATANSGTTSSTATASGIVTLGGYCLDGGAGSGKPVTIASCSGGASQLWKWHTDGELAEGSQCLEITGGSNATGALAEPAACNDSAQQRFAYQPDGTLYAAKSGKCLAAQGSSVAAADEIALASCDPQAAAQQWVATSEPNAPYTFSETSPVSFGNLDDTPASTFVAANGKFYYQSSYSLYGASDGRVWNFYTGSDFDTATADKALDDAVNPANPQDANDNTTWRCNNSPTGDEATAAPSGSGYAERNYCDLLGVWVDPDTGDWYGLVHNEFTPAPFGDDLHYDAIDYAVSTDEGKTWTIEGHAITSPYSTTRDDTTAFPNQTYYYGDGDPRLYVDNASGYFYVFYATRVLDKATDTPVWLEHVARSPIADKMAGGSWQKWYDGAWTQPGVGGKESDVIPSDGVGSGYAAPGSDYSPDTTGTVESQVAAGTMPDNSELAVMNITYDAYLGEYIGTVQNNIAQANGTDAPLYFYATKDLATEKWTEIGQATGEQNAAWYRWFLDSGSLTSDNLVGKTFRSYCEYYCSKYNGEYIDVTISPTSAAQLPAEPVTGGKDYQITAGDSLVLDQSGNALTAATASAGSRAQQWTFTPTGDGFYTIANAATGQVLGVNSNSNSGRAFDAAVTPGALAKTPAVGQEWFIEQIVKSPAASGPSVPTGAYKLVNRYSGEVLSLTAKSGAPVATAPQREWNNSGTAGDTRPVAAQTLTISAAN